MLVFRLGVLPRTCGTPCGEGPDGLRSRAPRALLSLPPLLCVSLLASHHDGRYFFISYFAVALVLPSLPLYPDTSLVTFHIQSLLAYLKARRSSVVKEGETDNANMETYVGILRERRYSHIFFL